MKVLIKTPTVKGELVIPSNRTKYGHHVVVVDLQMAVWRIGRFEDPDRAVEAALAFADAVQAGPFPGDCELERVSALMHHHLNVHPDEDQ